MGTYPIFQAGMTMAEMMVDHEKACQAMLKFYEDHDTLDTGMVSNFTPAAKVLELFDSKTARWPGDPKGLDVNNTYQFIEFPTLEDGEYDEFFDHPAEFWLTKHLPRTLGLFDFVKDIDYHEMILALDGAQNFFTSPQMIPVYKKLIEAAEEKGRMMQIIGVYEQKLRALGYYSIAGGGSATAFDMLGDTLRGTFGMMPDLLEERDNVKKALDLFVKYHIKGSLDFCRMTGSKYAWVMLHKGFDNFISDADYAELYWPYLRQWMLALIEHDITPVVYTEGSYTTRLKYMKDVPKNKVIYNFAKVDLKVGVVLKAEKHPDADSLLIMQVDLGDGDVRQIVSGISRSYTCGQMIGKHIVVISNLKPAVIRGVESQGMLLAGKNDDLVGVVEVNGLKPGTKIS